MSKGCPRLGIQHSTTNSGQCNMKIIGIEEIKLSLVSEFMIIWPAKSNETNYT